MKIGITCYPTYGGSGVLATELGKALAERGHSVHFISYALPMRLNKFVENVYFHEVELSNYPLFEFPLYSLALTSKMIEVMEYENLDIIHAHYAIPHSVSAYLAKQVLAKNNKKVNVVTTLHGTDITLVGLEPSFLPLVKYSIEESCGTTAVSRFLKEKTITNYDINKDIRVIYNFIDTDLYKPMPSKNLRDHIAPNGEKVLIHISNFRPVKRTTDVIKIFNKVHKEIPSKLVLVGDGPDRAECDKLAKEFKINNDIIFLGKQEALVEILNAADVFIIPSQSESFGLSALEAMSCGLPVVSSSVGGLPELIRHNETGYIAEIGDVDRMARYVIELLTNDRKYELFSKNSRERAVTCFDKNIIVPQYEEYYKEIIGKGDECFVNGARG